jgi:hypothetical protein
MTSQGLIQPFTRPYTRNTMHLEFHSYKDGQLCDELQVFGV